MDFISISIISIAGIARPERFPTQKVVLNKNFVKIKRVLVQHEQGLVYGEIDPDDEENELNSSVELENEKEASSPEEEVTTTDNGHAELEKSPSTQNKKKEVDKLTEEMFPSGAPISKQIPDDDESFDEEDEDGEEFQSYEIFEDSNSGDEVFTAYYVKKELVDEEIAKNTEQSQKDSEKDSADKSSGRLNTTKDDEQEKEKVSSSQNLVDDKGIEKSPNVPVNESSASKESSHSNEKDASDDDTDEEEDDDDKSPEGDGCEIMDFNSDSEQGSLDSFDGVLKTLIDDKKDKQDKEVRADSNNDGNSCKTKPQNPIDNFKIMIPPQVKATGSSDALEKVVDNNSKARHEKPEMLEDEPPAKRVQFENIREVTNTMELPSKTSTEIEEPKSKVDSVFESLTRKVIVQRIGQVAPIEDPSLSILESSLSPIHSTITQPSGLEETPKDLDSCEGGILSQEIIVTNTLQTSQANLLEPTVTVQSTERLTNEESSSDGEDEISDPNKWIMSANPKKITLLESTAPSTLPQPCLEPQPKVQVISPKDENKITLLGSTSPSVPLAKVASLDPKVQVKSPKNVTPTSVDKIPIIEATPNKWTMPVSPIGITQSKPALQKSPVVETTVPVITPTSAEKTPKSEVNPDDWIMPPNEITLDPSEEIIEEDYDYEDIIEEDYGEADLEGSFEEEKHNFDGNHLQKSEPMDEDAFDEDQGNEMTTNLDDTDQNRDSGSILEDNDTMGYEDFDAKISDDTQNDIYPDEIEVHDYVEGDSLIDEDSADEADQTVHGEDPLEEVETIQGTNQTVQEDDPLVEEESADQTMQIKEEASSSKALFNCKVSKQGLQSRTAFLCHMKSAHPESDVNSVKIESKGNQNQPIRQRQCTICKKTLTGIIDYNDHMNVHKNIKPYTCGCGGKFSYRHNLGAHRKTCKAPEENCKYPKYAESSFLATKPFVRHDPPLNKRVCSICERTGFNSILSFMDHKNMHSQERPYKCECGFDSNISTNLILHLKKEGCPLDGTTWPKYAQAYKEVREEKLRLFESKAKRSSFSKDFPAPKQIVCDSQTKYCCWSCDFKAVTTANVYKHYEEKHSPMGIQCPDCSKMFSSEMNLMLHKRKFHTDLEKCTTCNTMVPKKRLWNHIQVKHKKPFFCDDCGMRFTVEKSLLKHQDRTHKKLYYAPVIVTCPLCEMDVDIKNNCYESHLTSRLHYVYEQHWKEYNDIHTIPCYDCEDWETDDFEKALKHFSIQHKKGTKESIELMSILGKQDPELIKAVKDKSAECEGLPNIKDRQLVEEEKVLLRETKFANSITCFICSQYMNNDKKKSLDRMVISHIDKKMHLNKIEEWEQFRELLYYPCPDCNCENLTSLPEALKHAKKTHEYSYFEYFEFLRSKMAPAPDSQNKAECFMCKERVHNIKTHLPSILHRSGEITWKKSIDMRQFPCGFCHDSHKSLLDAIDHAYEVHRQPYLEYMHYLQISSKDYVKIGNPATGNRTGQTGHNVGELGAAESGPKVKDRKSVHFADDTN